MLWGEHPWPFRFYLIIVCCLSVPAIGLCFAQGGTFSPEWIFLTITSVFVATVNIRLPKISSVISIGDVFVMLGLLHFGPGPALLTYWADITTATLSNAFRFRRNDKSLGRVRVHRFVLNLGCCALVLTVMDLSQKVIRSLGWESRLELVASLILMAVTAFSTNQFIVSLGISLSTGQKFREVWEEGLPLSLLNALGSAAAAGLLTSFYTRVGYLVFFLSAPIAAILYQLYSFYIAKYEQAQKHITDLNTLYLQTIETMATAVDAKDHYTHGHIRRVQAYSIELARFMGIGGEQELTAIRAGALLHDIGKIAIPEYILNKPSGLTESEYDKMRLHPVVGANMLKNINFPYPVLPLVRWHHERWDGNGYPDGLKGEEIPLSARILALADCYDALTTNRPYRSPMPQREIIEFFERESGKAYDPNVVAVFIKNLPHLELVGRAAWTCQEDVWQNESRREGLRPRQPDRAEPTSIYSGALNGDLGIQRSLFSILEFTRANIKSLHPIDIFAFIGMRLPDLIVFDTAIFYLANLRTGTIEAKHVIGDQRDVLMLRNLSLSLEQKLSGWAAANNQPLCNLPPFPDFQNHAAAQRPAFQLCAIAPMNLNGMVHGAISVYRHQHTKFSEEEFRRLELVASQAAVALSRTTDQEQANGFFDASTGLPSEYQLRLMFHQIAIDASKFGYSVAILIFRVQSQKDLRLHTDWDYFIRVTAGYLTDRLREAALLVRYSADEFVAIMPRSDRARAEALKRRFQDDLSNILRTVDTGLEFELRISVGIATLPQDGLALETLLSVAWQRMSGHQEVRHRVGGWSIPC